jgi:predicted nucleic acid-binding protein
MLVVDASALTELVLARPAGEVVGEHLAGHGFALHAPHLLDVEVLSALRRARVVRRGDGRPCRRGDRRSARPAHRALPARILVPRAWQLRENFSAYDTSYIALAEAVADEPVPLLTADARPARAIAELLDLPVLLAAGSLSRANEADP